MKTTRNLFGTPLPNYPVPWQDSTSVKNGEGRSYWLYSPFWYQSLWLALEFVLHETYFRWDQNGFFNVFFCRSTWSCMCQCKSLSCFSISRNAWILFRKIFLFWDNLGFRTMLIFSDRVLWITGDITVWCQRICSREWSCGWVYFVWPIIYKTFLYQNFFQAIGIYIKGDWKQERAL